jgi:hypothetical protein
MLKMKTINKLKANFHSLGDILLFLQIFSLITTLPFLIKLLTLPQLMKILTPQAKNCNSKLACQTFKDKIIKYTDYILSRNFWIYKSTCLNRSLILYHFFRKLDIDIQICFGIRYKKRSDDTMGKKIIEGHAWLLHNGEFVSEANSEMTRTYNMTYCFPEKNENKDKQRNTPGVNVS